jgi:glycosyltransferase involved in cell wall biosynthesis
MAAVNLAMKNHIVGQGGEAEIFDLAADTLSRSLLVRLRRVARVVKQLLLFGKYLSSRRNVSVYMSISGGYGQLFEIFFILLSRIRNARLVLHHHSFLYIDHPRLLTKILVCCAGTEATHVVLCGKMAKELKSSYPAITSIAVVSNSGLLSQNEGIGRHRGNMGTIGFLGNIEADKGIFEFLDVLAQLQLQDDAICAIVAGPFFNKETERRVRSRIADLQNVRYVGSKYGEEKRGFFDAIDVLLYPTRNDAEPLTVLEAMSHGVPVVTRSRGCLDEMVDAHAGVVFEFEQDYVSAAVAQLRYWVARPDEFLNKSRGATERYRQMQITSRESLAQLCEFLTV